MKGLFAVTAALALLCLGGIAQADITIATVAVGDPGNAGQLSGAGAGGFGPDRVCGSVGYNYRIGKYEVTTEQYCDFLNKVAKTDTYGLYNAGMWSDSRGCKIQQTGASGAYSYAVAADWANRPVNFVSYWDSCRFANWLGNGQPTGIQDASTTERGAYTLDGYNGADGSTIQRNAGAKWAVTSEDEWYKAAYYKGGGTNAGYWGYPTRSDTMPSNVGSDGYTDPGNHASYYASGYTIGSPYYRTNAGEFENSASAYGTFDQGGNVWEWNEAIVGQGSDRGLRGGSFYDGYSGLSLQASARSKLTPLYAGDSGIGFRVSYIPEPSSLFALFGGLASLLVARRRRA